jgi:hypothetical protein
MFPTIVPIIVRRILVDVVGQATPTNIAARPQNCRIYNPLVNSSRNGFSANDYG